MSLITNGGGIRADKQYQAGQKLTRRDILSEMPFGNTTVLIEVTGAQIKDALENGVSQVRELGGRFPQVSGIVAEVDVKEPVGSRVKSVKINGQPLDPAKTYKLATNDFVARGGDGYRSFIGAKSLIDVVGEPAHGEPGDRLRGQGRQGGAEGRRPRRPALIGRALSRSRAGTCQGFRRFSWTGRRDAGQLSMQSHLVGERCNFPLHQRSLLCHCALRNGESAFRYGLISCTSHRARTISACPRSAAAARWRAAG